MRELLRQAKEYWPALDGLRALSILWVVIHHMAVGFPQWMAEFAVRGDLGVEIFFAISGFVVIQSLLSSDGAKDFMLKRVFRIIPAYWLTLGLIFCMGMVDQKLGMKLSSIQDIWASFPLFYYNYAHTTGDVPGSLNVFWSLCFEEQFYLFLTIAFVVAKARLKSVLVFVMVIMMVVKNILGVTGVITDEWTLQFATHLRMDAILIGCLVYYERERLRPWVSGKAVFFLIAFAVIGMLHHQLGVQGQIALYTVMPLVIGGLLISVQQDDWIRKPLEGKLIGLIGAASFEIYLTHQIVLGALVRTGLNNNAFIFLVAGLILSVVTGLLFHRLISSPVNKRLRSAFLPGRRAS